MQPTREMAKRMKMAWNQTEEKTSKSCSLS